MLRETKREVNTHFISSLFRSTAKFAEYFCNAVTSRVSLEAVPTNLSRCEQASSVVTRLWYPRFFNDSFLFLVDFFVLCSSLSHCRSTITKIRVYSLPWFCFLGRCSVSKWLYRCLLWLCRQAMAGHGWVQQLDSRLLQICRRFFHSIGIEWVREESWW